MLRTFATFSALSLGCCVFAAASVIGPGATAAPDVIDVGMGSYLAQTSGTLTAINPATGNLQYTETYVAGVYADPTNVFCSGCLDFYYQFANDGPGVNERFSAADFTGFGTDAGYDGYYTSYQNPLSVDRSSDGSVVGFNYTGSDTFHAGSVTNYLIVETDATSYTPGTFTVQDGVAVTGVAYAPTVTPEPASLALFGTGLLGVVGVARRKFNI